MGYLKAHFKAVTAVGFEVTIEANLGALVVGERGLLQQSTDASKVEKRGLVLKQRGHPSLRNSRGLW